jgi:hypothetical protein
VPKNALFMAASAAFADTFGVRLLVIGSWLSQSAFLVKGPHSGRPSLAQLLGNVSQVVEVVTKADLDRARDDSGVAMVG